MGLKKGPETQDYMNEVIWDEKTKLYEMYYTRNGARAFAKKSVAAGARVRTFKIAYRLVADSKPAKGKRK